MYGNYRNGWEMLTKMDDSGKPDRKNHAGVFRIDGNCMESMGMVGKEFCVIRCPKEQSRTVLE